MLIWRCLPGDPFVQEPAALLEMTVTATITGGRIVSARQIIDKYAAGTLKKLGIQFLAATHRNHHGTVSGPEAAK
ncbi:MAG: hypothetical protein WD535_05730 [Thermaerobacterales bacterium]